MEHNNNNRLKKQMEIKLLDFLFLENSSKTRKGLNEEQKEEEINNIIEEYNDNYKKYIMNYDKNDLNSNINIFMNGVRRQIYEESEDGEIPDKISIKIYDAEYNIRISKNELDEIIVHTNCFIGTGTYGLVKIGFNLNKNDFIATKHNKKRFRKVKVKNAESKLLQIENEYRSLKNSGQEGVYLSNSLNSNYINLPLFKGDLLEYNQLLNKKQIIQGFSEICKIHYNNTLHRDIKPENIFINKNNNLVIGDFGLSTKIGEEYTTSGTPVFVNPETINFLKKKSKRGIKIDEEGFKFLKKNDYCAYGISLIVNMCQHCSNKGYHKPSKYYKDFVEIHKNSFSNLVLPQKNYLFLIKKILTALYKEKEIKKELKFYEKVFNICLDTSKNINYQDIKELEKEEENNKLYSIEEDEEIISLEKEEKKQEIKEEECSSEEEGDCRIIKINLPKFPVFETRIEDFIETQPTKKISNEAKEIKFVDIVKKSDAGHPCHYKE